MGDIIRGTTSLSSMYRGSTEIQKVYHGSTEVWASLPPLNWNQSDNGMVYGAWKPPTANKYDGGVSGMRDDWYVQLRVPGNSAGMDFWGEVINTAGGEVLPHGVPIRMQGRIRTTTSFDARSRYEVGLVHVPGFRYGYSDENWPYYLQGNIPSHQTLIAGGGLNSPYSNTFDQVVTLADSGQVGIRVRSNRPSSCGGKNTINLYVANLTFTYPE